jgi:serine/threonine-protein kinase
MSTSPGSSDDRHPVEELADDFLRRQRAGERPTMDEYCLRHPELADDIRELFPVLIRMEDLRSDGSDGSTGGVAMHAAARLTRVGDFRILREVGRGGMGVVYEAEQESLGRRVALKVLPESALSDSRHVLRFQREARAAARLHHTNIVPVFGVGHEGGHHYYVMQFIPGMGLDTVLGELRRLRRGQAAGRTNGHSGAAAVAEAILTGRFLMIDGGVADGLAKNAEATARGTSEAPLDRGSSSVSLLGGSADSLARSDADRTFFLSVAGIGRQVAEALEYANRQGVLHRDVKPSNLLLDPRGNVWVTDFGLAKSAEGDDLTHTGDLVGTLRYMAPERFRGGCDARSDVYALGLTLYELLALRPAYEASDRHELMRRVMNDPPERLRKLVPIVPHDLETIVEKAIAREPAQRYSSAAALAEDLQRFLEDRPIMARPAGATEQVWRWARRNPVVSSLAAGLMIALVGGLVGVTWQWRQAAANLELAEAASRKAQERFGLAMEAVKSFTTGASEDVLLREKQLVGLRNKLLEGSLDFYSRLADLLKHETDRDSQRSLAVAMYEAAELNGRIGRHEKALEGHRQALSLREALAREAPSDVQAHRELGRSELAIGEMLAAMGRQAEARQAFARARAVAEVRLAGQSKDAEAHVLLADSSLAEAQSLLEEYRLEEARPFLERAWGIYDGLVRGMGTAGEPERYLRGRAVCSYRLGRWWHLHSHSAEPLALAAFERATADYETLTRMSPGDIDLWLALADCHFETARYLDHLVDRQHVRVRRHVRRAKAIYERLARENPTVAQYRAAWGRCLIFRANILRPGADREDVQERFRETEHAVAIFRELVAADPNVPLYVAGLGDSLVAYGTGLIGAGRPTEGIARQQEAYYLLKQTDFTRSSYSFEEGREIQTFAALSLSINLVMVGRAGAALEVIRQGIGLDESRGRWREAHGNANLLSRCYMLRSYLAFGVGRKAEAAESAELAAALLEPLAEPNAAETWDLGGLHLLWYMQGRAVPGRRAEPSGRPEHAARAVILLRQAADKGLINLPVTAAFFGPVLGHLPEYQSLMMDLPFPADPFGLDPAEEDDDGPLP